MTNKIKKMKKLKGFANITFVRQPFILLMLAGQANGKWAQNKRASARLGVSTEQASGGGRERARREQWLSRQTQPGQAATQWRLDVAHLVRRRNYPRSHTGVSRWSGTPRLFTWDAIYCTLLSQSAFLGNPSFALCTFVCMRELGGENNCIQLREAREMPRRRKTAPGWQISRSLYVPENKFLQGRVCIFSLWTRTAGI